MSSCGSVGPPPPPFMSGSLPSQRIQTTSNQASIPSCVQNAMMTKDKKPFTYLPSGIDLSQIKSPTMANRIQMNANLAGVTNDPRPAQAQPTPYQTSPSGARSGPPPPPPAPMSQLKPDAGRCNRSPSPQIFEPPPLGCRPEIKIPPNPMASLRKVPSPVPKDDFWVEEYRKERSKSPMPGITAGSADANQSPSAVAPRPAETVPFPKPVPNNNFAAPEAQQSQNHPTVPSVKRNYVQAPHPQAPRPQITLPPLSNLQISSPHTPTPPVATPPFQPSSHVYLGQQQQPPTPVQSQQQQHRPYLRAATNPIRNVNQFNRQPSLNNEFDVNNNVPANRNFAARPQEHLNKLAPPTQNAPSSNSIENVPIYVRSAQRNVSPSPTQKLVNQMDQSKSQNPENFPIYQRSFQRNAAQNKPVSSFNPSPASNFEQSKPSPCTENAPFYLRQNGNLTSPQRQSPAQPQSQPQWQPQPQPKPQVQSSPQQNSYATVNRALPNRNASAFIKEPGTQYHAAGRPAPVSAQPKQNSQTYEKPRANGQQMPPWLRRSNSREIPGWANQENDYGQPVAQHFNQAHNNVQSNGNFRPHPGHATQSRAASVPRKFEQLPNSFQPTGNYAPNWNGSPNKYVDQGYNSWGCGPQKDVCIVPKSYGDANGTHIVPIRLEADHPYLEKLKRNQF